MSRPRWTSPKATFLLEVGVLLQGRGRICVDDVRLESDGEAGGRCIIVACRAPPVPRLEAPRNHHIR